MYKRFGIGVNSRNSHIRGVVLPLLFVLSLGATGCSLTGNSLPNISSGEQLVTNSIVEKTKPEGIAETDAEIIKNTVTDAKISTKIKPLAWTNPQTGSSGTIIAIDKFMGKHGQNCRGFKTSVDSFMGIAFYNGEACQISAGKWVLSWFKSAG